MGQLRRIDHDEFMMVAKALYGEGAWEIVKSRAPEKEKKKRASGVRASPTAAPKKAAGGRRFKR